MSNILKFPQSRIFRIVPKPSPDFVLVGEAAAGIVRRLRFRIGTGRTT